MMSSRCPFPSVSDVRAVWGAGPDGASPTLRATLRERYGCQVLTDASLGACDAVAARLESSVSPAKMAELAGARR